MMIVIFKDLPFTNFTLFLEFPTFRSSQLFTQRTLPYKAMDERANLATIVPVIIVELANFACSRIHNHGISVLVRIQIVVEASLFRWKSVSDAGCHYSYFLLT